MEESLNIHGTVNSFGAMKLQIIHTNITQHRFEESSKAIQLAPDHCEFEIQQLNMDPWMRHEVETVGCIKLTFGSCFEIYVTLQEFRGTL